MTCSGMLGAIPSRAIGHRRRETTVVELRVPNRLTEGGSDGESRDPGGAGTASGRCRTVPALCGDRPDVSVVCAAPAPCSWSLVIERKESLETSAGILGLDRERLRELVAAEQDRR